VSTVVLYLVLVAIAAAVAFGVSRRTKQQIARAKRLAAKYGFEVDTDSKGPPGQQFDQFGIGRERTVSFQFWRAGEHDSVFHYRYTTGSGDDSTTHLCTLALISLAFAAPHTKIGPEGFWSGIRRAVGFRDIEVESTLFNDQFRVTGNDERFAVALLDQEMLAWLLSPDSSGGAVKFELWGSWLLCVSEKLDLEQMFGFLDWGQSVRSHMPGVLGSLYPLS